MYVRAKRYEKDWVNILRTASVKIDKINKLTLFNEGIVND